MPRLWLLSRILCHVRCCGRIHIIATAKSGEEDAVLKLYRAPSGRHKVIEQIAKGLPPSIASPLRSATGLLSFWRDEAAHGTASEISEIEAHEAAARLIRFSQFTNDRWTELTSDRAAKHA